MTYGSVCSGMEAASLAWGPLGWRCAFTSEIEKAPCALLEQRFPGVPNFGDMTKFEDWPDVAIDLLAGGTPCQSFSVAGLRRGLTDPRGSLMLIYGAIAKRYRPTWLFWENVPGVLSSNGGRDFGAFLGMLAELGYGFAYRVLDAQFFGLAQRRKRVFVVGHLGDWRPPAAVLFERQSLRGDSPPRRETGEAIAVGVGASLGGSDENDAEQHRLVPQISHALNAHGGAHGRIDAESETFITHALKGEGFDASEDGTGRGTPIIAIQERAVSENVENGPQGKGYQADVAYTLEARNKVQAVAFDTTQITSKTNRSQPRAGEPCHPVTAEGHAPAIAFSCKDHGADAGDLAPTLRAMGHADSHANAGGQLAVAFTQDLADPLTASFAKHHGASGGKDSIPRNHIVDQYAVRRLTPRECERLQGAPDDHTLFTYRGKAIADAPRYKMIGNSWAVPCVRWIGERIDQVNLAKDVEHG